ncbi:RluA family pseudouridine synthase [Tenacibaculum adriaticum]|uniref:RluA family pseudouridine synthase n=1 Tax=Tenacibaculum adriaticum TaxID=413713 RepID=A0A5S5DVB8_9FLAO|nr:RluA family pseudouridine synthase [Tenacibaculum adriaticum]TYP99218.1 RluA family pseudouridine synthase [Tenacibaculum adriaticum]
MKKLIEFSSDINGIPLPKKFTYPFYYTPHPLAKVAVEELQEYLKTQTDFKHNFGIENPDDENALGKMFGVLVVQNSAGELGYLTAFSGKLAEKTQHKYFVPPVFDVLDENGVFRKTENENNQINLQIEELSTHKEYLRLKKQFTKTQKLHHTLLKEAQRIIKKRRKARKLEQSPDNQLNINEEFYVREYEVYLNDKILPLQEQFEVYQTQIDALKKQRKQKSAWVQQEVFKQYQFLNAEGSTQNLLDIFKDSNQNIPAGAGDCCAPKLLQYAFLHHLTPIAIAEFWWGKPVTTSVRKHQYFYPACSGKCKPILTHMLQGLQVDENPLLAELQTEKELEIVFEDEFLLIVNKPAEFLSAPGKEIEDSVYSRIQQQYPEATGPLLVHRLDMSTSGILLVAKNKNIHQALQKQFLDKTVQKRYVALLDGELTENSGTINLPLRLDLDDRPKQVVCYEHGKPAVTKWEVIEVTNHQTKVYLYPITGRTHQLRMHVAHSLGLHTPIIGDDLYGQKANRLHLHAESITFTHPKTKQKVTFTVKTPF